jgi:serine/threonine protein kinase
VSSDPRVGTQLGPYRLDETIGRGGMGVVYLARDLRLDRRVAVKIMAAEVAGDPSFRERFEREARMAAAIDHPNIIPIYDTGDQDGVLYLAMRYVPGTDLRTLLVESGALPTDRAVSIMRQVASALDAAHAQGLVHRDVKPANILLASGAGSDETDHVYLTDFGLTKRFAQASRALTATGQFVGTIDYVAPEQVEGQDIDGRADQYSLACVMFECLTGAVVFGETSDVATLFAHVQQPPPPVTSLRPDLPVEVDEVMGRGLAKRPDDRYATCGEFVTSMRDALAAWGPDRPRRSGGAGVTPAPPAPPPPLPFVAPPIPGASEPAPSLAEPTVAAAPPVARSTTPGPSPSAPPAPSPPTEEAPGGEPPGREPPPRRSRAPLLAGGAVAALVVGGLVVFALTRGGGDGTESPTTGTGSTTGTTTTTTPTGPVGPQLAWRPRRQDSLRGAGVQGMSATTVVAEPGPEGNTLVAAGSAVASGSGNGPDAAVWLSHDGLTWTPAPGQAALERPGPQAISGVSGAGGKGLVAVGSDGASGSLDAAVWLSHDGGEHWTRVTGSQQQLGGAGAQSMNRVAGTSVGFLAVGFDTSPNGDRDGAVWLSKNQTQWTEFTGGDLGGAGDQEVRRISRLPGGGGFLAAGSTTGPGGDSDAAIWRSTDGRQWTLVPGLSRAGNQAIDDLQAFGDLLVAGGFDDRGRQDQDAAVWVSTDGATWTETTGGALGGDGDQVVSRVYPTGTTQGGGLPQLVAGGFEVINGDRNAAMWYSDDGRTWTRETSSEARLGGSGGQDVRSIVAVNHGFPIIAVGSDNGDAGLWAAEGPG